MRGAWDKGEIRRAVLHPTPPHPSPPLTAGKNSLLTATTSPMYTMAHTLDTRFWRKAVRGYFFMPSCRGPPAPSSTRDTTRSTMPQAESSAAPFFFSQAEKATTPAALPSGGICDSRLKAPRNLKAPTLWRVSGLIRTRRPSRSLRA